MRRSCTSRRIPDPLDSLNTPHQRSVILSRRAAEAKNLAGRDGKQSSGRNEILPFGLADSFPSGGAQDNRCFLPRNGSQNESSDASGAESSRTS